MNQHTQSTYKSEIYSNTHTHTHTTCILLLFLASANGNKKTKTSENIINTVTTFTKEFIVLSLT